VSKHRQAMPATRQFLETLARIMGPASASAQALRDMDAHGGPSEAIVVEDKIVVVKHSRKGET